MRFYPISRFSARESVPVFFRRLASPAAVCGVLALNKEANFSEKDRLPLFDDVQFDSNGRHPRNRRRRIAYVPQNVR